jgi:hypothetical protein
MKLTEVTVTFHEEVLLIEKLGTLAKLGMPKLVQVMKQQINHGGKHSASHAYDLPDKGQKDCDGNRENKFRRVSWGGIGARSEIIDVGEIKKGMADLRKAYREHERAALAFALYLDDKPVAFCKTDDLSRPSEVTLFAYDLTPFSAGIDKLNAEAREKFKDKSEHSWEARYHKDIEKTSVGSAEKTRYDFSSGENKKIIAHKAGDLKHVGEIPKFLDLLKTLGKKITCKLVFGESPEIPQARRRNKPVEKDVDTMRKELYTRLHAYKLSKKPTVANIHEFLKMAMEKGTGIVQFAGSSYTLKKQASYAHYGTPDKLDSLEILSGKPFTVYYQNMDGGYDSVLRSIELKYAFDSTSKTLIALEVKWNEGSKSRTEVLDHAAWLRHKGIKHENKDLTIKHLLAMFKEEHKLSELKTKIKSLRASGIDWPELNTIEKSVDVELKKKGQHEDDEED